MYIHIKIFFYTYTINVCTWYISYVVNQRKYVFKKKQKEIKAPSIALQSILKIDSVQFPVFLQMSDGFCTIALFIFRCLDLRTLFDSVIILSFMYPSKQYVRDHNGAEIFMKLHFHGCTVTTPAATQ